MAGFYNPQTHPVKVYDEGIPLAVATEFDFTGDGVTGTALGPRVTENVPVGNNTLLNYLYLPGREGGQTMIGEYSIDGVFKNADESIATLYVATTGNDTTGDGTLANPFASIERACEEVNKFINVFYSIINVADGTYNNNFVNFPTTVRGIIEVVGNINTPNAVILNGNGTDCPFNITGEQMVSFKGFTIDNVGENDTISVSDAKLMMSGVRILDGRGIYVDNGYVLLETSPALATIPFYVDQPYSAAVYAVNSLVEIDANLDIQNSYIGIASTNNSIVRQGVTAARNIAILSKGGGGEEGVQIYGSSAFSSYGNISYNGQEVGVKTSKGISIGDRSLFFQIAGNTHTISNCKEAFSVSGSSHIDGVQPTVNISGVDTTYNFDYSTIYSWTASPTFAAEDNYGFDYRYLNKFGMPGGQTVIGDVNFSTGNVGIGVASPQQRLDIAGHASFTQISAPTNTATAALAGAGAGNVDIGDHSYKFAFVSSVGETAISSAATNVVTVVDNATNGKVSLTNIPQSADSRVTQIRIYRTKAASATLYYLLATISHGTTTYTDNIADSGLSSNVWNFKENTTAGRLFLNGATQIARVGIQNTCFGYIAGSSLTSGYGNMFIGNSAGRFSTEAFYNVALGTSALQTNTTGNYNVAIGTNSFYSNSTGSYGVAIGYNAGYNCTNPNSAMLIGYSAASSATNCTATVAIGTYSLYSATNASYATAIGYRSLYNSTSPAYFVSIGYGAGYSPGGVAANTCTTATYCTFLGAFTGLGSTTQRTKAIAIGYNAVVDADNACVIGGSGVDAVKVGLGGVIAPTQTLDILGGYNENFTSSGITNPTGFSLTQTTTGALGAYILGMNVSLTAGYTGSALFTQCLSFDNPTAGQNVAYFQDNTYGYRLGGNRGVGGYARAVTVGHNVGGLFLAGNGAYNYAVWGASTTARAGSVNVGVFGAGLNTGGGGAIQVGGYFTTYGAASVPLIDMSCALLADNGTQTTPIFIARDNGANVFSIIDGGVMLLGKTVATDANDIFNIYGVQGRMELTSLYLQPSSGSSMTVYQQAFGAGANWNLTRANGTKASPTNIANGNIISSVSWQGYYGGTYYTGAEIRATVDAAIGGTAEVPMRLGFYTTPDGSTTPVERMRITNAGYVGINCTPNYYLDIAGDSFPVMRVTRNYDTSDIVASGFLLRTKKSTDMGAGYGGGFVLGIEDDTSGLIYAGRFACARLASDSTSRITFDVDSDLKTVMALQNGRATFGNNVAGQDFHILFEGETNDGSYYWMEDEDYFKFEDSILFPDSEPLYLGTGADMSAYYDGTNGYITTALVAPSDLHINCGTDKTIVLDESVWEDIQFSISSGRTSAANYPDWDAFTTTTSEYKFDVNDYIDLGANEMAHWWKEGTDVSPHLHLTLDGANTSGASRWVKFTIYFAYADVNEVWTETSFDIEKEIVNGTADMTHILANGASVSLPNNKIGSQVKIRIKRIAATSGVEYPNHIFVTQFGIHAESDTMGSRTISSK